MPVQTQPRVTELADFSEGLVDKIDPAKLTNAASQALVNARVNTDFSISKFKGMTVAGTPDIIPRYGERFLDRYGVEYMCVSDGEFFQKSSDGGVTWSYITFRSGNVIVTNGSAVVTSVDAPSFLTNVVAGEIFVRDGDSATYVIASVDSATQFTLATVYTGTSSTSTAFDVRKRFGYPVYSGTSPYGVVHMFSATASALLNSIYFTNGLDIVFRFDGVSAYGMTAFPKAPYAGTHRKYFFTINGTTLQWSAVDDPTSFPATHQEDIGVNVSQGDKGTAVYSFLGELIVFTRHGLTKISGTNFTFATRDYTIQSIPGPLNVGCIYPRTLREVYLPGRVSPVLVFMAYNGWYQYNGYGVEKISTVVDNTFTTVVQNLLSTPAGITDNFSDGDYTQNPTWTVREGAWRILTAVGNPNALQTNSDGICRITLPSVMPSGTWQFSVRFDTIDYTGPADNYVDVSFMGSVSTGINGFTVRAAVNHISAGATNVLQLLNSSFSGLISTSVVWDTAWHVIKITRTSLGVFELFLDGASVGTVTDTTAPSPEYFHIYSRFTVSGPPTVNAHSFTAISIIPDTSTWDPGDACAVVYDNVYRCSVRTSGNTYLSREFRWDERQKWLTSSIEDNWMGCYFIYNELLYAGMANTKFVCQLDTGLNYIDTAGTAKPMLTRWKSSDIRVGNPTEWAYIYDIFISYVKKGSGTLTLFYQLNRGRVYTHRLEMDYGDGIIDRKITVNKLGRLVAVGVQNNELGNDIKVLGFSVSWLPFRQIGHNNNAQREICPTAGMTADRPASATYQGTPFENYETGQMEIWNGASWEVLP